MNKQRALRLGIALVVLVAIVVALHVFDPIGLIRHLHGLD
jgi:hypothetical protein